MNILVSVNDGYVSQLIVMLNSLFLHNREESITVYLLYSDINRKNLEKIAAFVKRSGQRLAAVRVDGSIFVDMPKRSHTSLETYYRLLVFDILEPDVERILYLDPDMLILCGLRELYHMNMGDHCFAACRDILEDNHPKVKVKKKSLRMPEGATYINAGMLLINMNNLRKFTSREKIFTFMRENRKVLKIQDQDVLNAMFHDRIIVADPEYNSQAEFHDVKDIVRYLFGGFLHKPKIIHYAGPYGKPWSAKKDYGRKYIGVYKRYCDRAGEKLLSKAVRQNQINWVRNLIREAALLRKEQLAASKE